MSAVAWDRWRKCPVCHAALSAPCRDISGALIHGRPYPQVDPVTSVAAAPHSRRQLRTSYARTGGDR